MPQRKRHTSSSTLLKPSSIFFPGLYERLDQFEDPRNDGKDYSISELIMAALSMHIFKSGSRNAMNEARAEKKFSDNYRKMFKLRLPHMDTVNVVLKLLDEHELETLKVELVRSLIEKKVFHKLKLFGTHFMVAVDATGVHSYDEQVIDGAVKKEYKYFQLTEESYQQLQAEFGQPVNVLTEIIGEGFRKQGRLLSRLKGLMGNDFVESHNDRLLGALLRSKKTRYYSGVLEAKLIGSNGFCLSLSTEWIENPQSTYDKQDCEMKAFSRLSVKLKKAFKRLSICIIADGLYPNKTFFDICRKNDWEFICVLQKGSLKTVRQEIDCLVPRSKHNTKARQIIIKNENISEEYQWINDLDYEDIMLHWIQCMEYKSDTNGELKSETNFEYVCSQKISLDNVIEMVGAGRLRQRIEESFNTQKNLGYQLKHKYSRTSSRAIKNYYQCMQIAHLINQLLLLCDHMKKHLQYWACSLKHCWKLLMGFMIFSTVDEHGLETLIYKPIQYRYTM